MTMSKKKQMNKFKPSAGKLNPSATPKVYEEIYKAPKRVIKWNQPLVGKVEPDLELLRNLVTRQSPSQSNELLEFVEYLIGYLGEFATVESDKIGNIYVTKGKANYYPCIVAHTDTNQSKHGNLLLKRHGDCLYGFDSSKGEQAGCGFDDKLGVLIAIQCLKKFDNIKLFLPINEEIGCFGTLRADMSFFKDVGYCIQPDRNSYNNDFITHTNGVTTASAVFTAACDKLCERFNYKEAYGMYTDIGELVKRQIGVSCINISAGYIREHTDAEICIFSCLHNALNFTMDLVEHLGETLYLNEYIPKYQGKTNYADKDVWSDPTWGKWDDDHWWGESEVYWEKKDKEKDLDPFNFEIDPVADMAFIKELLEDVHITSVKDWEEAEDHVLRELSDLDIHYSDVVLLFEKVKAIKSDKLWYDTKGNGNANSRIGICLRRGNCPDCGHNVSIIKNSGYRSSYCDKCSNSFYEDEFTP